jgi:hypothetical protein
VRELQHAVERAVILSPEPMLQPHAFDPQRFGLATGMGDRARRPPSARRRASTAMLRRPTAATQTVVLNTLNVAEAERVLIQHALEATDQNRTRAAGAPRHERPHPPQQAIHPSRSGNSCRPAGSDPSRPVRKITGMRWAAESLPSGKHLWNGDMQ